MESVNERYKKNNLAGYFRFVPTVLDVGVLRVGIIELMADITNAHSSKGHSMGTRIDFEKIDKTISISRHFLELLKRPTSGI